MSLPVLIGFAGVLVAAVATGLLAGRCVRQRRIGFILWTAATLALAVALAAQAMGFARGFTPVTFRAVQVFGLLLAPLWLAWGLAELVWPSDAARFGARLVGSALTVVATVILATDPLTGQPFGKSWPLAGAHYQAISDYVLDVVQAVAVITAAVSAGLAAARSRDQRQRADSLAGTASAGLAVLMTAGLRFHLPAGSVYPLACMLAAALVWFGATRIHQPPGRRDRSGLDRGIGEADDYDLSGARSAASSHYPPGDTEDLSDLVQFQGSRRPAAPRRPGGSYRPGAPYEPRASYGSGAPYRSSALLGPCEPRVAGRPGQFRAPVGPGGSLSGGPGNGDERGDPGWPANPGPRPRALPGQDRYHAAVPAGTGPGGLEPGGLEPGGLEPGGLEPGGLEPGGLGRDGGLATPPDMWPAQPFAAATAAAAAGLAGAEADPGAQVKPAGSPSAAPVRPYGRILVFTLLEDRAADFDRLAEQTAEEVRTREPDTLVYVIHLVPDAPLQRIFYEIYRDRAAFDSHQSQPYMQRFAAERRSCVLATNVIELRLKYAKIAPLPASPAAVPGARAQLPLEQAQRPQRTQGPQRPRILEPLPPAPLPAGPDRRLPPAERRYGGT